jgi:hypothetical protein
MTKLIVLIAHGRHKPGDVIERPDGVANLLVRRRLCAPAELEAAAVEPATERAVIPRPRKRRSV